MPTRRHADARGAGAVTALARVACLGITVQDRILSVPVLPTKSMKIYATATEEAGGGSSATGAVWCMP